MDDVERILKPGPELRNLLAKMVLNGDRCFRYTSWWFRETPPPVGNQLAYLVGEDHIRLELSVGGREWAVLPKFVYQLSLRQLGAALWPGQTAIFEAAP